MDVYNDLIKILDTLRNEAPTTFRRYYPEVTQIEELNKARAKAYIHLFLKVKFGLTDFLDRRELGN